MTQISNRTLLTDDNLPGPCRMHSACVGLIYLDLPFNSNRSYSAGCPTPNAGEPVNRGSHHRRKP